VIIIPASQFPAAIEKIRRIEIILAVETDDVDINSKERKRIIYSTSVIPRNHAASS
jgi:esterase/lipase superfamily enzyme